MSHGCDRARGATWRGVPQVSENSPAIRPLAWFPRKTPGRGRCIANETRAAPVHWSSLAQASYLGMRGRGGQLALPGQSECCANIVEAIAPNAAYAVRTHN